VAIVLGCRRRIRSCSASASTRHKWYDFERLQSDNPAVRILGHDEPAAGRMIVHLACASRETRDRLDDGWN
jgi:hypothetical protein